VRVRVRVCVCVCVCKREREYVRMCVSNSMYSLLIDYSNWHIIYSFYLIKLVVG